jgi:DNA-directed RNA polymerase specialized sigma24 family protein
METEAKKRGRALQIVYSTEAVEKFKDRLTPDHFAILMCSTAGDYASISSTLNLKIGTVKSRLNRARIAIATEIKKKKQP